MRKTIFLLCLLIFNFVQSQSIFKEDLSTYTIDATLNSQEPWTNNSATFGLGGCAGTGCTNANVIAQSMNYSNYGTTTKALKIELGKDGVGRAIPAIGATGDIYVSLVLNLSAAASANDFLRAVGGGSLTEVKFRLNAKANADDTYSVGIRKGGLDNATVYAPEQLIFGADNLIILKYSHLPGASDDVFNVYINPPYELGEPSVPSATSSIGNDQLAGIDRLGFRLNQNTFMPTGAASLVSVAKDWSSLGFVPLSVNNNTAKNPFTIIGEEAKNGILSINSSKELNNANLSIYTITGMLIENSKVSIQNGNSRILISPIQASGLYIIRLIDTTGKNILKKLLLIKTNSKNETKNYPISIIPIFFLLF